MPESAIEIVDKMSDLEVVRFLQHFGRELFEATTPEAVTSGVLPELTRLPELDQVRNLSVEARARGLEPGDSARVARTILQQIAQDDGLADALLRSWEGYKPQELFVEAILAVGLAASMMLLVATTEIELDFKGVKVRKGKASGEQIKAIAEPFFSALGRIAGGLT